MVYFSRLTDIVTCSLSNILENEANKKAAIEQIIKEMEEGLAGAKRSVETATASEKRLCAELEEHSQQIKSWLAKARDAISSNNEAAARTSLQRKLEEENIVAGLELQHKVSVNTLEHLSTTMLALEGRLAEARRKEIEISGDADTSETEKRGDLTTSPNDTIEEELANLKREMGLE